MPQTRHASEASKSLNTPSCGLDGFWDVDAGRASTWFSVLCFTGTLLTHAFLVAPKLEDIPDIAHINDFDTVLLACVMIVASLPLTAVLSMASHSDEAGVVSARHAERRLLQANLHHALLWQCITLLYTLLALIAFSRGSGYGLAITPQLADAVNGVMWASMADVVARAAVLLIPHGHTQQRNMAIWMSMNQIAYSVSPLLGSLVDVRVEFFAICIVVVTVAPCLGVLLAGKACTRALHLPDTWLVPDVAPDDDTVSSIEPSRMCGCRCFGIRIFTRWFEVPPPSPELLHRLIEAGRRYISSFASSIILTAIGGGSLSMLTLYDLGCAISNTPGGFASSSALSGHSDELMLAYQECASFRTSISGTSISLRAMFLVVVLILAQMVSIVSVVVRVSTIMLLANVDQAEQQAQSTAMLRWLSHECRSPIGVAQLIVDSVRRETLVQLKQAHNAWHRSMQLASAPPSGARSSQGSSSHGDREVTQVQEHPSAHALQEALHGHNEGALGGQAPPLAKQGLLPAPAMSAAQLKQQSHDLLRSLDHDTLAISQPLAMLGGVLDNMLVYLRTSALQGGGAARRRGAGAARRRGAGRRHAKFLCVGTALHDFGTMAPPLVASFDAQMPRMTGHGLVVLGSERVYSSAPKNSDPLTGLMRSLLPIYSPVNRATVIQVLMNLFTNALKYGVTPVEVPTPPPDSSAPATAAARQDAAAPPQRQSSGAQGNSSASPGRDASAPPLGTADLHLGVALAVHGTGVPAGWDAHELRSAISSSVFKDQTPAQAGGTTGDRMDSPDARSRSTSPPTTRTAAGSSTGSCQPVVRDAVDEQIASCTMIITLTDKGRGMTYDELNSIFQPFSRLRSGTQQKGTGLGLWLMRELLHSQGGELTVRSAGLGQGCTFSLSVPCLAAKEDIQGFIREACGPPCTPQELPAAIKALSEPWHSTGRQHGSAAMLAGAPRVALPPSGADTVLVPVGGSPQSTPPRPRQGRGGWRSRGIQTAVVSPSPPSTSSEGGLFAALGLTGNRKLLAMSLVQALSDSGAAGPSAFLEIAKVQLASVSSSGTSSASLSSADVLALSGIPADRRQHTAGTATTNLLSRGALRVLVVDDGSALRKQLSRSLRRLGCQVLQAADGKAALDILKKLPPHERLHGVICDMSMPLMDGPTFVSHVRKLEADGHIFSALPDEVLHRGHMSNQTPPGASGRGVANWAGGVASDVASSGPPDADRSGSGGQLKMFAANGTRLTSVPEADGRFSVEQDFSQQQGAFQRGASSGLHLTSPLQLSGGGLSEERALMSPRQGSTHTGIALSEGGIAAERDPDLLNRSPSDAVEGGAGGMSREGTVSIRDYTRQPSVKEDEGEEPPSVLLRGGTGYVTGESETSGVRSMTAGRGEQQQVALRSGTSLIPEAQQDSSDGESVGSAHSALVGPAKRGQGGFDQDDVVGAESAAHMHTQSDTKKSTSEKSPRQLPPLTGVSGGVAPAAKPPASPFSVRRIPEGRRLFSTPLSSPERAGQRQPIAISGADSALGDTVNDEVGLGGAESVVSASQSVRYEGAMAESPMGPGDSRLTKGAPTEGAASVLSAGSTGIRMGGAGGVMWRGDSFGPTTQPFPIRGGGASVLPGVLEQGGGTQRQPVGLGAASSVGVPDQGMGMDGGPITSMDQSVVSASQSVRYEGVMAESPMGPGDSRLTKGAASVLSAGSAGIRMGGAGGVMWRGDSFGPQSVGVASRGGASRGGISAPFSAVQSMPAGRRVSAGSPLSSVTSLTDKSGQRQPVALRQDSSTSEQGGPSQGRGMAVSGPMIASHSLAASGVSLSSTSDRQPRLLSSESGMASQVQGPVRLDAGGSLSRMASSHHPVVSLPSTAPKGGGRKMRTGSAAGQMDISQVSAGGLTVGGLTHGGSTAGARSRGVSDAPPPSQDFAPGVFAARVSDELGPGVGQQLEAILSSVAPDVGAVTPPLGGWEGLPRSSSGRPLWHPNHFHDTDGAVPLSRVGHPAAGLAGSGRVESAHGTDSTGRRAGWDARRLPVIGLTGNALEEDMREFLEAGADTVLTKPLAAEAVLVELHSLTRSLRLGSGGSSSVADSAPAGDTAEYPPGAPPSTFGGASGRPPLAQSSQHTFNQTASLEFVARDSGAENDRDGGGSLQYSEGGSSKATSLRAKTMEGGIRLPDAVDGGGGIQGGVNDAADARSRSIHTQDGADMLEPAETAVQNALRGF